MSFRSEDSVISNQTFGKDASFKLAQLRGSLSISPSGRDICLGSKEGLHIIDLDSPYSPPRFLPHRTSWEVADVQWSPFAERDAWVASTSNQKALVWNLNAGGWRNSIEYVLHAHTRAITDINFSAHSPDKLATCAVDSFVHCWDLRSPDRPAVSFSDWFAGATQVKWNRQDEHVIASAHDKFLHIWDDRFGARPARTIEAHNTKIYGIDWNRFEPSKIVTCSLDRTIKFWNTSNEENSPDRIIETDFPVWRARHTPFGWGLMVMPQRGIGDLYLYDRRSVNGEVESGRVKPVHIFPGHKGQVKEFLWRFYGTVKDGIDHRDFQLVSWGTDQELKLHAVSRGIFENVGYEKGVSRPQRLRFTRRGAKYRTFRDEPTEQESSLDTFARADSFHSSTQIMRSRGRISNSATMNRWGVAQINKGPTLPARGKRSDMHGKGAARPETDPIAWMKNVKIASWDTDALADEITQIGERFRNVEFETLDVPNRRATMSMQSFWGEQPINSVYTRIDFKFPKDYPREAQASITVQKTNSISGTTQQILTRDARKIAEACQLKGRGCMEAIIRFLLKERTLEQTVNLILRDSLVDSRMIEAANFQLDGSDDSDDDPLTASSNAAKLNAEFNVPHAKGCAAYWSEDGRLVCFFQQKVEEPASLLAGIGTSNLDENSGSKLFGGFGKFQTCSPARKARDSTAPPSGESSGEESDGSSLFSSSSSSSGSSFGLEKRTRVVPWRSNTIGSIQRTKSPEGSQNSNVIDSSKVGRPSAQATVRIFDFEDLLCCNKNAAQGYMLEGAWPDIIDHNRRIAGQYNLSAAMTAWDIAGSVLKPTTISQQCSTEPHGSSHTHDGHWQLLEVMPAILIYLESHADVQTLGVISFLFLHWLNTAAADITHAMCMEIEQLTSQHIKTANGVRNDYSADGSRRSSADDNQSSFGRTKSDTLGSKFTWSEQSLDVFLGHNSSRTQSSSATPSVVAHDPSGIASTVHSSAASLAGSPESSRLSRMWRPAGAATNLYARIKSRPSSPPATSNRSDASRLNVSSKSARVSPDDNFIGEAKTRLRTSLSLVNVSGYGRADGGRPKTSRSSTGDNAEEGSSRPKKRKRKQKLKTTILMPEEVTLDQSSNSSSHFDLMISITRCTMYLRNYLPLLDTWQLCLLKADTISLLAQTEELLDVLRGTDMKKQQPRHHTGLSIDFVCTRCGQDIPPSFKGKGDSRLVCRSPACGTHDTIHNIEPMCAICETFISPGLVIPCLKCKHILCFDCGEAWFGGPVSQEWDSRVSSTTSNTTRASKSKESVRCPTGCGCYCAEQMQENNVPVPITENVSESQYKAPATPHSEGYQEHISQDEPPGSASTRVHRGQSVGGHNSKLPESAIHALLALQSQARHRSTSSYLNNSASHEEGLRSQSRSFRTRENSLSEVHDEMSLSRHEQYPSLRRTLSNKGSDSTIRRVGGK